MFLPGALHADRRSERDAEIRRCSHLQKIIEISTEKERVRDYRENVRRNFYFDKNRDSARLRFRSAGGKPQK